MTTPRRVLVDWQHAADDYRDTRRLDLPVGHIRRLRRLDTTPPIRGYVLPRSWCRGRTTTKVLTST